MINNTEIAATFLRFRSELFASPNGKATFGRVEYFDLLQDRWCPLGQTDHYQRHPQAARAREACGAMIAIAANHQAYSHEFK